MKNLFKSSKENSSYQSLKTIPDAFFHDNTHSVIPIFSRLSPSYEQMLNLPPARQMFLRYLRSERLQGIFYCFRDLINKIHCTDECNFNVEISIFESINSSINAILNEINSCCSSNQIFAHREQLESHLEQFNSFRCHFISIYTKYFSIKASEFSVDNCSSLDCIKNSKILYKMLVEIFREPHQKQLSSFQVLEKYIYNYLSDEIFPNYLNSNYHHQYQLQLLNSGLNSLQLSDFIYSDEYLMIITEFLELKSLNKYLAFLLAVINLTAASGICSFDDILDVYSKFLVIDSVHYIEIPNYIINSIINKMCSSDRSNNDFLIQPNVIFECAFRPIYLFLEQYWLPEFLVCSIYQRYLKHLHCTIETNQFRRRNVSENTCYQRHLLDSVKHNPDDGGADNTSVQSEPVMSHSTNPDISLESIDNNHIWWPEEHIEDRLSRIPRPMSLGNFDDLGRYQSLTTTNKRQPGALNSTSSEILSTINELGSDLFNKFYVNPSKDRSRTSASLSVDEIARRIISDVQMMNLINQ